MEEINLEDEETLPISTTPVISSLTFSEFMNEAFRFAIKPTLKEAIPFSWLTLIKTLGYALVLDFGLMTIALIIMGLVVGSSLDDQHQFKELLKTLSPLVLFFMVAILAPLLEETIFRLFLRFHTLTLFASILAGALFFIPRNEGVSLWIVSGVFAFIFLGLVGLYLQPEHATKVLKKFWEQHFWVLYYASVLIFGLAHISNYNLPVWKLTLLAPILVLPQILLGFILGYLRIRFGFVYAVLLHAFHNGILILPVILFKDLII